MSQIPRQSWRIAQQLYMSGKSMRDVATALNVSLDAVTYVLRRTNTARRKPHETNKIKFLAKPASFLLKKRRGKKAEIIDAIGAMLYWAEGYKTEKALGMDFANSDPEMVLLFLTFLRSRYLLDETRLRCLLYCYENQRLADLITYWSTLLLIPQTQFTKPYIKKNPKLDGTVMKYGVIHIRYSDKKLLNDIRNLINSYRRKYRVGGRVVNYTTL
jgi:hypothetical protein